MDLEWLQIRAQDTPKHHSAIVLFFIRIDIREMTQIRNALGNEGGNQSYIADYRDFGREMDGGCLTEPPGGVRSMPVCLAPAYFDIWLTIRYADLVVRGIIVRGLSDSEDISIVGRRHSRRQQAAFFQLRLFALEDHPRTIRINQVPLRTSNHGAIVAGASHGA